MAVHKTDLDLTTRDLAGLTSPDALTAFLSRLGYDTSRRTVLTASSLGLSVETAAGVLGECGGQRAATGLTFCSLDQHGAPPQPGYRLTR